MNGKYVSFFPNDYIIVLFSNETIYNSTGEELIIETYGKSTTQAHVSVSTDNKHYEFVGVLNNTNYRFDIDQKCYTFSLCKITFFGSNNDNSLNVMTVLGKYQMLKLMDFAYYVQIPQEFDEMVIITITIIFILYDCHFYYDCYTYCFFKNLKL